MAHDEALIRASELVAKVRDVVDERAVGATPPSWCTRRAWAPFLASLSNDDVDDIERRGLAASLVDRPDAPAELVALGREISDVTTLSRPSFAGVAPMIVGASERKRAQVHRLGALLTSRDRAPRRVIDVGSGHGHLTRWLATTMSAPVIGWERDPARVRVANERAGASTASFVVGDVEDLAHTLREGDLVVGLHACGALGDLAVEAAARAGADVALVACCMQKRTFAREPLCAVDGVAQNALVLGRDVLGLANARDGDDGIEDDLTTRGRSRLHRLTLALLLSSAGVRVQPGEEMRGVNRRQATRSLDALIAKAFAARGLSPPSRARVDEAAQEAEVAHQRRRRWELPRTMMARLIEVWVARDRAAFLAANGHETEVLEIFPRRESPRNVIVLGRR